MKRIGITCILLIFFLNIYGQPETGNTKATENDVIWIDQGIEGTMISVGPNGMIKYKEDTDTIKVKLGKRGIKIIETDGGTSIDIIDLDEVEDDFQVIRRRRFYGHWAGFELGLNNFATKNFSLDIPEENRFMELNTGKSWNFNINFLEYGLGLGTDKVGLVTGLGVEFNNYRFDNPLSIMKDNGFIVPDSSYVLDPEVASVEKSKFHTAYLTLPLLLEFQVPAGKRDHRFHFSAGAIGGVKLWSYTKMVYKDLDGNKMKDKEKGNDYNLSPFRYGVTARIGYRALNVYANYNLTPLFEKRDDPELYPFSIGLVLIGF
ncbi:MAG: PorT family protein [Bacteroidales bacterium]|nr:MAG: PorT family protein [Bacteroidales bacterium]